MKRVLVVDDSPTETYHISNILNKHGYEVVFAETGELGVELAQEHCPDLVLMDIHMPIKDGVAATREIRDYEREKGMSPTPIIALTADISKATDEEASLAGFDRFIFKPVSKEGLRRLLVEQFGDQALVAPESYSDILPGAIELRLQTRRYGELTLIETLP